MSGLTENEKEVLDEYKKCRSPFRVATQFGMDVNDVWKLIEANPRYLEDPPEKFGGMGRPQLRDFIVARRLVRGPKWDNTDPNIRKARELVESGHATMATGRDGGWEILYSIPLRRRAPRPGYFKLESMR